MLPSHRPTPHVHGLPQPAHRPAVHDAAAHLIGSGVTLALPAIDPAIPAGFSVHSHTDALLATALTLADAGVLTAEHWDDNLRTSVAAVFTTLAARHLPKPLADYTLLVVEDTVVADLEYDTSHGYHRECKLPEKTKVSALVLTFNHEAIVHRVIGPAIKRLEKHRAGLGQTIFYWLHTVFAQSARALDPVSGYGHAQLNYWGGEDDESMRLEEELDYMRSSHETSQRQNKVKSKRVPFDEAQAIKDINIFTKADYDAGIPPAFGTKFCRRPKLSLAALAAEARGSRAGVSAIIPAALAAAKLLRGHKNRADGNDVGHFEKCRWDMTPYLLRWQCSASRKSQDPLAQLYDDYMNDAMQSGEDMLDVNAVFAWHDSKTLCAAVRNFETYCRRLHAAEQLLLTLAPKET